MNAGGGTTGGNSKRRNKSRIGVKSTPELQSLIQRVLALPQHEEEDSPAATDDDTNGVTPTLKSRVVDAALKPELISSARTTIQKYIDEKEEEEDVNDESTSPSSNSIPLNVIHATRSLIHHHNSKQSNETPSPSPPTLLMELEQSLLNAGKLIFHTNTPKQTEASKTHDAAYQRRLERLRFLSQERDYTKLTSNLDTTVAADVSVKSMMYATSVGLNMIVAPITFGVFMYFFSGALFGYWDGAIEHDKNSGKLDIRKVIIGVISGVAMMFIEMILFVIRNHEMDRHVTKKMKNEKRNPFGYVKAHQKRTFNG
eukprot:CAMPEP_0198258738 /NCGR_PEP_ID=MMETSP1447-20131203/8078_1 /TAXON_ID=420782 /ORGANISM="Chaetoceros dichaeta, Strain CCMP1751" /LENGTH=312 /DNA_ID=CAMNT_0043945923 /DNA_START=33 /DNA_END=971 /DNA_ORIENTATION=+